MLTIIPPPVHPRMRGERLTAEKAMEDQRRLSIKAMVGWIKRFGDSNGLVESDARDLVERFGDQAYYEARDRAQRGGTMIDGNRPRGHWTRVKLEIAKRQGIAIGLTGSDRRD